MPNAASTSAALSSISFDLPNSSTNTTMSKNKNPTMLTLVDRERLRVAATVTQESDWPQSEPNQGLARMFVIMLLVHIVVIGGVIIYDFVGQPSDTKSSKFKDKNAATASSKTPAPLPVVNEPKPVTPSSPSTPAVVNTPAPVVAKAEPMLSAPIPPPPAVPVQLEPQVVSVSLPSVPAVTNEASAIVESKKAPVMPQTELPVKAKEAPAPAVKAKDISELPAKAKEAPVVKAKEQSDPPARPMEKVEASASVPRAIAYTSPAVRKPEPKQETASSSARKSQDSDSKRSTTASKSTGGRYTVAKGDTIIAIAKRKGVSADALMKANGIKNANSLQIGKSLVIPSK
jgi:LysM repeat protein